MGIQLHNDDCLNVLPTIPDGSVDCIITDLPYGVTNKASEAGKWDSPIPMEPLWEQFWRVLKPNGACVLFAQGMFTAQLMMSQPKNWRYNLIWDKCRASGFLNAKRMPLRYHEDICVFYRSLPTYNPQLEDLNGREPSHSQGRGNHKETNRCYGNINRLPTCGVEGKKFPKSILSFPRPHCTGNHPTEKSVELCRWLVRTFTNPGETVLDATMGSGTTLVAAALEGRKGIGIELVGKYYDIAVERVMQAEQDFTSQSKEGIIEEERKENQHDGE
jgi:DNA modification methylase